MLFTFKGYTYKNVNNTDASANYDVIMVVLNGKNEQPIEAMTVGTEIQAEHLCFDNNVDAICAGNQTIHPTYASSGVASQFSNSAFVKDIKKDGVLEYAFTVESDCTVNLVVCAVSTSTNTVDMSKIFEIYIGEEKQTYSDSTIAAKPSDSWTPSETVVVKNIQLKAGVTYVLTFKSITTGTNESVFYDYIKFVLAS